MVGEVGLVRPLFVVTCIVRPSQTPRRLLHLLRTRLEVGQHESAMSDEGGGMVMVSVTQVVAC